MTNEITRTIALDWESYFDSECSVKVLGNRGYFAHPKFDAYLLSAVSDDGVRWVGHPKDFDWSLIEGAHVLSHHAAFDQSLYWFGVEKGWYPDVKFLAWDCTLDACSFHGVRRSLKNAAKDLFGVELSKETRDNMKDLDWATMTPEFKKEVEEYALADSDWCLKIWEKLAPTWPEFERRISRHTRQMCWRGIAVDEPRLRQAIEDLSVMRFELESEVPWTDTAKLKSRNAFDAECRKHGLTPPKSLAKSDPAAEAWFAEHEEKHAWMAAFRNVGRVNTMLLKLQTLERQTIEGIYYPYISYHNAHTGRFSSGGGLGVNIQNLTKGELFGVNMREMFIARPGKKFAIVDLSQIEVRTALWLAGAKKALEEIRKTDDLYHALAVAFELWKDEQGPLRIGNPKLRQGTKIVGLGVLYGASAKKVAMIAKIPLEEAERWVWLVKTKFPEVPKLWTKLTSAISRARSCPSRRCELKLPSGRAIQYRNIRYQGDGIVCDILKGASYMTVRPWFGMTCENCLAGDTIVLTDQGPCAIVDVSLRHRLWDGTSWVAHDGLVAQGTKPVLNFGGVRMTPDHRVLTASGWVAADASDYELAASHYRARFRTPGVEHQGSHGISLRAPHRSPGSSQGSGQKDRGMGVPVRLRGHRDSTNRGDYALPALPRPGLGVREGLPAQENSQDAWDVPAPGVRRMALDARSLPSTHAPSLGQLRGAWCLGVQRVASLIRGFLGGHGADVRKGSDAGPAGQLRGLHARELRLADVYRSEQQSPYEPEVTNSVGGDDVVPSGSAGGATARHLGASTGLRDGCRDGAVRDDGHCVGQAAGYSAGAAIGTPDRGDYGLRPVYDFEKNLGGEALGESLPIGVRRDATDLRATGNPVGEAVSAGAFREDGDPVWNAARSGSPGNDGPRFVGREPVYDLLNAGPNHRFTVIPPDGAPFIVSNCSQGMARDAFMDGALRVEDLGFPILFHVHDEIIAEVDEDTATGDLEAIIAAMSTSPEWCPDIPLSAEGSITDKYTK